jgi:DNA invertase Pin-like site-specific DNA recombinase
MKLLVEVTRDMLIGYARVSTPDQSLDLQRDALTKAGCTKVFTDKTFHVMASLAAMERGLTVERTRAGLQAARQLGHTGGRKRQMTDSKIASAKKLLASGVPPKDVAVNLSVSVPTLYRWLPASARA